MIDDLPPFDPHGHGFPPAEPGDAGFGVPPSDEAVRSAGVTTMDGQLAVLRDAFDRSFADPPRAHVVEFEDLLAIRLGTGRHAVRLTETAGLHQYRPVTPLLGPLRSLLGVAGFRGAVMPVYDLGAVMGLAPAQHPQWLVLASGAPPFALAFDVLDGHLRVPRGEIVEEATGHGTRGSLRGMVRVPGGTRPIVDLVAVRAVIHDMAGLRHGNGER